MTDGILETMVEHVPSWGYMLLLLLALFTSMYLSRAGLKACYALFGRIRRS